MLNEELDSVFEGIKVPILRTIQNSKMYKAEAVRVFNPDFKTIDSTAFEFGVRSDLFYVAINEDLAIIKLQSMPIYYYDKPNQVQAFNATHSNLAVMSKEIDAFSLA